MAPEERLEWTGHVCGLCLTLKNRHGHFSRLTTNYDAALLSALYDAQTLSPQSERLSYCPLRNSFKAKVIASDNPGVRYAASMALMMASSKIKDHILDNETGLRHIRGIATGVADRWMRSARKNAAVLGFDADRIEHQVHRQIEVEAQKNRDFFLYAEPTELAVGAAFEHTAVMADRPENRDALRKMGNMFGRIIYLLDSYEDYASDIEAHKFNALAASFTETEWRAQAVDIFHQAYGALKKNFQRLDLPRPDLVHALLIRKLKRTGQRNLQICKEMPESCCLPGLQTAGDPSTPLSDPKYRKKKNSECACDCCCYGCDACSGCDGCSGCDCCGACDCSC